MRKSYFSSLLIHGIFSPHIYCLYSSLTTSACVTASQVCRRGFVIVYVPSELRTQCASKKMRLTRFVELRARCGETSTLRVTLTVG